MSLLKYLMRAKRMDCLIRSRSTGSPHLFAKKLGISRRLLLNHIRDFKELGAPIRYSYQANSYYYSSDFVFFPESRFV